MNDACHMQDREADQEGHWERTSCLRHRDAGFSAPEPTSPAAPAASPSRTLAEPEMSWVRQGLLKTVIFTIIGTIAYCSFRDRTIVAVFVAAFAEELARAIPVARGFTPYRSYVLMGVLVGVIEGASVSPEVLIANAIGHVAYGIIYETCRRRFRAGAVIGVTFTTAAHFAYNSSPGGVRVLLVLGEVVYLIFSALRRPSRAQMRDGEGSVVLDGQLH